MGTKELPYQAFMAAIKHEHREEVKNILLEYNIGAYIIANEISKSSHQETNGEHIHFVVEMTPEEYHRFSKRVFIDKFKLRGRAAKGKPRQYGKVNKIDNVEKMKIYSLKEGDYISNLSSQELETMYEKSYKKAEDTDDMEKLYEYLGETNLYEIDKKDLTTIKTQYGHWELDYENKQYQNYCRLCRRVIKYYIENNKNRRGLTKTSIECIVRKYIMYIYEDMDNDDKTEWLYNSLFNKYV